MKSFPYTGQRIVVVGTTGSGKTMLAAQLAAILGITHIEIDALHWDANWTMPPLEVFRQRMETALASPRWVADGNYGKVRDLTWGQADALVWLDYNLPTIVWRLLKRTFRRVLTREALWNSNRETFRGAFLAKDSLFTHALRTHKNYRKTYPLLFGQPEYAHLRVVRLYSPKATQDWLSHLRLTSISGRS